VKIEKEVTVHLHVHGHDNDSSVLKKLNEILERLELPMAESPEVTAFRERVELALGKVAADIQRLLARSPALSEEDKAAFNSIATKLEDLDAIVPEEA